MNTLDYEIRLATEENFVETMKLLQDCYFKQEPLIKYLTIKYQLGEDYVGINMSKKI